MRHLPFHEANVLRNKVRRELGPSQYQWKILFTKHLFNRRKIKHIYKHILTPFDVMVRCLNVIILAITEQSHCGSRK